jgi:hypothetical protein
MKNKGRDSFIFKAASYMRLSCIGERFERRSANPTMDGIRVNHVEPAKPHIIGYRLRTAQQYE